VRAVAYANGGKLRARTDQEQQLWSECSRLLANCIIYYNACILSALLERAERRQDYQRADAIKRANPASWKHANLYGAYRFLDIGDGVDLQELVNLLEASRGTGPATPD
jgi:Tn3 transposase DDE domain